METVFVSNFFLFRKFFITNIFIYSIDSNYNLSCSDFHICFRTNSLDAHIIELRCPSGLLYDTSSRVCNFAELVDCSIGKFNNILKEFIFFKSLVFHI